LLRGRQNKVRKSFFFEKKNQKTFPGAARRLFWAASLVPSAAGIRGYERAKHPGKVFWFFFSKKNCFLAFLKGGKQ
jgi:hypothetical protein